MKKITFLIISMLLGGLTFLLTTGFTSEAVLINDYDNPISLSDDTIDEEVLLTETEEEFGNCGSYWSGILTLKKGVSTIKVSWRHSTTVFRGNPQYMVHWSGGGKSGASSAGGGTSYTIKNLKPSTNYTVFVKRVCPSDIDVGFKSSVTTCPAGGCGYTVVCKAPTGLSVSGVTQRSVTLRYVNFNSGTNVTNQSLKWYVTNSAGGGNVLGQGAKISYGHKSITITNLIPGATYKWKIIKSCDNGTLNTVNHGKSFSTQNGKCNKVKDVRTDVVKSRRAMVSWKYLPGAAFYKMAYKENNGSWKYINNIRAGDGRTTSQGGRYRYSTDVKPSSSYVVMISAKCGSGWTDWSASTSFTTKPECPAPTGLRKDHIKARKAQVKWNKVPDAEAYALAYTLNAGKTWKVVMTSHGKKPIHNSVVTPNTSYHVVVMAHCNGRWGGKWSKVLYFRTPGAKSGVLEVEDVESPSLSTIEPLGDIELMSVGTFMGIENHLESIVYPTVNNGVFSINFAGNDLAKTVSIYDLTGQQVFQRRYDARLTEEELNLSGKLTSGMYKIKISTQDNIEYKTIIVR